MSSNNNNNDDILQGFPSIRSFTLSYPSPNILSISISTNKHNTMNKLFWSEIVTLFQYIANRTDIIRCVIITGNDNIFTAGLDLTDHIDTFTMDNNNENMDPARRAIQLNQFIQSYQLSI